MPPNIDQERRVINDPNAPLSAKIAAAAVLWELINSATKALSLELASRGVTVNAIAPGIIASPMAAAAFDAETIKRLVPVQRAGTPEEVAALAGFLASPEAGYITGQVISVNGGIC